MTPFVTPCVVVVDAGGVGVAVVAVTEAKSCLSILTTMDLSVLAAVDEVAVADVVVLRNIL